MKPKTWLAGTLLSLGSVAAHADVVLFVTNTWDEPRSIKWTGSLDRIDTASGVAHFSFLNGSQRDHFEVHLTRILSLVFDGDTRRNKPFPQTRMDLSKPLPTTSGHVTYLELSNADEFANTLPTTVSVRPSRSSPVITLKGQIVSINSDSVKLQIQGTSHVVEVDRDACRKWIR